MSETKTKARSVIVARHHDAKRPGCTLWLTRESYSGADRGDRIDVAWSAHEWDAGYPGAPLGRTCSSWEPAHATAAYLELLREAGIERDAEAIKAAVAKAIAEEPARDKAQFGGEA